MFRASLMNALQGAYQLTQLSNRTGIAQAELLDRMRSQAVLPSRRRFLQGGLAIAGLAALPDLRIPAAFQPQLAPVLVVGAGIAGLTTAYRLQQAGVPVNVVEARGQVGGRMQSLSNAAGTSIMAETGAEFVHSDHAYLHHLIRELDLPLVDLFADQAGLVEDTFFFGGRSVSIEEIIQDFVPIANQISADLQAIDRFDTYATFDPTTAQLDRLSLAEYLDRIPTSDVVRQIINVAYMTEYGLEADQQSCLNLLYLIGTKPDKFSLFGTSAERFGIVGGNDRLPRMLADRLATAIEPDTALEKIRTLSDGRYRVTLRSGLSTTERTYERVVLATPFSVLRNVVLDVNLPPLKRKAIDSLGYGTNNKLITSYGEKVWKKQHRSTANIFSDLDFQTTWEASHSRYGSNTIGLLTNFVGGRQGVAIGSNSVDRTTQQLLPQIDRIFPGMQNAYLSGAVQTNWVSDPYSLGSYTCYRPGQWTEFYGIEGERVNNLFFAGEHCSLEYQGWMEGACESGELVALDILSDLGLSAATVRQKARIQANERTRQSLANQQTVSPIAHAKFWI